MTYKGIEHLKFLEIEGTIGDMGPQTFCSHMCVILQTKHLREANI